MKILTTNQQLSAFHDGIFVPTMGALHAGHVALIREAARVKALHPDAPPVIVSIFVNPTQFNNPRDLQRYPRTLEADAILAQAAGADIIYAPAVSEIYPDNAPLQPVTLPPVATEPGLEDAHRPGHFAGVYQVVRRLFELVRPRAAIFGEKDWQQLQVVRALIAQEHLNIQIIPLATVRESDGLAMSSRNVFLSPEDRIRARQISEALCSAAGEHTPEQGEAKMREKLESAGFMIEYACVRECGSLKPLTSADLRSKNVCGRSLIAIRVSRTSELRLIDNAPWRSQG